MITDLSNRQYIEQCEREKKAQERARRKRLSAAASGSFGLIPGATAKRGGSRSRNSTQEDFFRSTSSSRLDQSIRSTTADFELDPEHPRPVVVKKTPSQAHIFRVSSGAYGNAASAPVPQKNGVFAVKPNNLWPVTDGSVLPKPEPGSKSYGPTYVFSKSAPQGGPGEGRQYWPQNRTHLNEHLIMVQQGKAAASGTKPEPPPPPDGRCQVIPKSHNYACGPQCYCMKSCLAALSIPTPPRSPRRRK